MQEAGQCSSSPGSSFSNKKTLHRSLSRADNHLPKSPHKKAKIIEKLVEKYYVKIPFNTKRGRPWKYLNEEEKKWLETFLSCSDVSYTNPGRKGHLYVGKIDGERRFKQRLCLFWNLRDLLDIIKRYRYRESRCHRYLLSEFREITNIFSTIWFREISQGILLQSKYSTRNMFMWNMWKLPLACKGIEY